MTFGKPIREPETVKDEWVHTPTDTAPHLWTNRRTGFMENREPVPPPQYTYLDYMGPPVVVVEDTSAFVGEEWFGVGQTPLTFITEWD